MASQLVGEKMVFEEIILGHFFKYLGKIKSHLIPFGVKESNIKNNHKNVDNMDRCLWS